MNRFLTTFPRTSRNIIGMIHVPALPGTPSNQFSIPQILDIVGKEVEIYSKYSEIDALIIENMHDLPYVKKVGPEIVSSMTVISQQIRSNWKKPLGIQILAGCNKEALAVSQAVGLEFIRAEGFVFSHVADEGWMDSCAGDLLRYQKSIDAQNVCVFCDIKKKHSAHSVTSDVNIVDTAHAAKFFKADGVIVTGNATGDAANANELNTLLNKVKDLPILVGSGVTKDNLDQYKNAHGLIIGSYFKKDGQWQNQIDPQRIDDFVAKL